MAHTENKTMTINPETASNLVWFYHATDRMNYWQSIADKHPTDQLSHDMVAQWQREKMKAYADMTTAERVQIIRNRAGKSTTRLTYAETIALSTGDDLT
jgi:hypothetical protein